MLKRLLAMLAVLMAVSATGNADPTPDDSKPPALKPLRLEISLRSNPCDPQIHVTPELAMTCFDPLFIWQASADGPVLKPCLAADWPEYSDDGLTCIIRLRDSACFEDAVPHELWREHYKEYPEDRRRDLTSSDVLFTLKRAAKYRNFNAYVLIEGLISGLDDIPATTKRPEYRMNWDESDEAFEPEGIELIDDQTLRIRLTRPTRLLPVWLANPCFCIVSPSFLRQGDEDRFALSLDHPRQTSGPFAWQMKSGASWHFEPKPGTTFAARSIQDSKPYYASVLAGLNNDKLDYALGFSIPVTVQPDEVDPRVRPVPLELMYYLAFNMKDKVWGAMDPDGRALRHAVSAAIDRKGLAETWSPDSLWGATASKDALPARRGIEQLGKPESWSQGTSAEARAILKGTAYEKVQEGHLKMIIASGGGLAEADCKILEASLKPLGVTVEWKHLSQEEFRKSVEELDADAWFAGWWSDSPHPAEFLRLLSEYHSAEETGFGLFPGGYSSDEFDSAFRLLESLDPASTSQVLINENARRAVSILERDRPYVPLVDLYTQEGVADGVVVPPLPLSTGTLLRQLNR